MYVFFPFILDIKLDVPAGVTQDFSSHTHYWYEVGMLKVSANVLYRRNQGLRQGDYVQYSIV